jgi:hypothetical protein
MHYIHNRLKSEILYCIYNLVPRIFHPGYEVAVFTGLFVLIKHTNLMIAPIFIRSETLSLKRNS